MPQQGWSAGPAPDTSAWTPGPTSAPTNEKPSKSLVESVKDFAGEALAGVNPVTINNAIQSAFWHPIDTVKGVVAAQDVPRQKAMTAFEKGNHVEGVRHLVDWLIPLVGPRIDQAADYMQQGEIAKGLGATADVAGQIALPTVAGKVGFNTPRLVSASKNAAEAAATAFGKSKGVLIDAGTETGSQFVKNVQKRAGATWGGANVTEAAQATQAQQLARVGGELADQVHPSAVQPVQAGEGIRDTLAQTAQNHATTANTHYDLIRAKEAAEPAKFAIDITSEKAALKPLYTRLAREAELAPGSVMGDKAVALKALDRLQNGPDVTSLTVLDEVVSDLRSLSGANDSGLMAEARTAGQGVAAQMVKQLDAKVKTSARAAGSDVINALEDGRASTAAKYEAVNVSDLLANEPRGIFDQLTRKKDGGINKLRAVEQVAPTELPKLGRALLEDLLDKPTSEGGFKYADKARADWERLGPETRRMLFGTHTTDIDNFFLLAKKIGENPNPSGTAQVLSATQILVGIPGYAMAKILYSPKAVRTLTTAVKVSANPAPAARAFAVAQVARAAKEAGVTLPLAADQEPQR